MKSITIISLFLFMLAGASMSAQESRSSEQFGNTLNFGLGIGYYGYIGHSMPVVHFNYEFDVARNFTLAPFVTVYSYQNHEKWGDKNHPKRDYYYRVTSIPIGVKGTYYFDQIFNANSKWDFYAAGSLGAVLRTTSWESGYLGDKHIQNGSHGLYLDFHMGTEYHFNNKVGLFLDLSTGISTIGLAFKM